MATWNGARFLEQQMESLFAQTFQDFRLIVRDDGSTDATLEIVERYQRRYPGRVAICKNPIRLGPSENFSSLAAASVASYVAFCDQDDIWHKNKLAMSFEAMQGLEEKHGRETPVIVFSDMTPIDEEGKVLASSWWKMAHVNPARASLGAMLVQNLVTGCTTMANRNLVLKACPIPIGAEMHDSWFGLVAAAFGVLCPLTVPTVQYRQHDGNAWGASQRRRSANLLQKIRNDRQLLKQRVEGSRRQARLFAHHYGRQLSAQQRTTLTAWARSGDLPAFVRQWTLHRNGLRGTTLHNHLGFLARV